MPAQSPTLSPTLSAIVAGLRGSSSGMPASTLPTRSAPTSAAFVKMPPPTRRNRASSEPPKPNPTRIAELVFWNTMMISVRTEEAEADREHAGHAAGPEGDRQRLRHAAGECGSGRAHVAAGGQRHADVAGETRRHAAEQEGDRPPRAGLEVRQARRAVRLEDLRRREEHDRRHGDDDHGDGAELPLEVGQGALLDGPRDLPHLGRALVLGEDRARQVHPDRQGQQRGGDRQQQDGPLAAVGARMPGSHPRLRTVRDPRCLQVVGAAALPRTRCRGPGLRGARTRRGRGETTRHRQRRDNRVRRGERSR